MYYTTESSFACLSWIISKASSSVFIPIPLLKCGYHMYVFRQVQKLIAMLGWELGHGISSLERN